MDIDVFQLPGIVLRRIRYVVVTAILFALVGIAFVMSQPNLYRASAELILDPERFPTVGQSVSDTAAPTQVQQGIDSQIYVMQSRDVFIDVVRKLDLQKDAFFMARVGLIGRLLGKTAATAASQDDAVSAAAGVLGDNIIVTRADQSLVFTILAQHPDARRAAEIANTVSSIYLDKANRVGSDKNLRASMELQVQAEALRVQVEEAEGKVEAFRARNGLINTGAKGLVSDQVLESVSQQLINAKAALEQQEINYNQVRALTSGDIQSGSIPEALQQTSVSTLRARYAQSMDRLAELQTHLGARHPQLQTARSQVASMRTQLEDELKRVQESVRNTYQRSRANVDALQQRFDSLQSASGDSGDARTGLNQLQSEATSLRGVYTAFLTRAEELSRQYQIGTGNSRIISEAQPPSRTNRPSAGLLAIAGLLFGAAVGAALAVVRELLGSRALSHRQLVEILDMPVVAKVTPLDRSGEAPAVRRLASWLPARFRSDYNPRVGSKRSGMARRAGVTRIAYLLSEAFDGRLPATVVFVGPGAEPGLVGEIAASLFEAGAIVDVADGAAIASLSLAGTRTRLHGASVFETLRYQRFEVQTASRARSSGSLLSVVARPAAADYALVDLTGIDAGPGLTAFVRSAAAVMIVVRPAETSRTELGDLALALTPWKSKNLGTIVVEAEQ